jgi:glycosyltransferase involved in cell wall biosynthesis
MIRVAALLDAPGVSGPARQLSALARALRDEGVVMTLIRFHRQGRPLDAAFSRSLDRDGVPHRLLVERGLGDFSLLAQLRTVLAETGAEIIETHGYKPTTLAWLLRMRGPRLPWIGFFHGATAENLKIHAYQWLDRWLMRRADRVVVMSAFQASSYARLGPPVDVIYNAAIPLAEESLEPGAAPVALSLERDGPRIGVAGRLSPEKGCDVFLRAAAELKGHGVAFQAVFAGDGPERRDLGSLAAALELSDRVHFAGHQADMRPVYRALDLLVIPSRSEGLPNVLLEALQADLPVVATRVGAIPEVLSVANSGVLVPPNDPHALCEGIRSALAHLGDGDWRAARRLVTQRFTLQHRVVAHRDLYVRVLTEALGSRARVTASAHG